MHSPQPSRQKLRVVVTRRLPEAVETRMKELFDVVLRDDDAKMSRDDLAAAMRGADVLVPTVTDHIDANLLAQAGERLKLIANFGAGVDHIDVHSARQRGILVTNTPGVVTEDTADMVMALILGVTRRIPEGMAEMQAGRWGGWAPTAHLGGRVGGRRLGILGMGRIGQAVARRARGFDMEIHYHNRRRLPAGEESGAIYHANADDLLAVADFLSIHSPANPETHHWLNAERIARLPDGAVVVNTARGSVVDDEALLAALASGKLAAAGLDVFENEPRLHPGYAAAPNTFLLPHLGSATDRTRDAMGFTALNNLDAFFAGRELPNRVA